MNLRHNQKLELTMRTNRNQLCHNRLWAFPVLMFFVVLLFSSCVTQRDLEYLRDRDNQKENILSYVEAKIPDYKLKPNDELSINIKSLDDPATNVFQMLGNQQIRMI